MASAHESVHNRVHCVIKDFLWIQIKRCLLDTGYNGLSKKCEIQARKDLKLTEMGFMELITITNETL